jgi:hypothetical protein
MKTEKSKTLRKPSAWRKITRVLTKRTAKAQGQREAARIPKRVRSGSEAKTMKWKSQETSKSAIDFLVDILSDARERTNTGRHV